MQISRGGGTLTRHLSNPPDYGTRRWPRKIGRLLTSLLGFVGMLFTGNSAFAAGNSYTATAGSENVTVTVKNTAESVSLTGLPIADIPFFAILAIVVVAAILIAARKVRKSGDEDE